MNDGKSEKNEKGDRHLISLSFAKHPVRKICYYLSTQSTYGANIFEPCLISTGTPYSKHTIDCICFLFVTPFFDSQCRANLFFLVNHLGEWRIIMPVNHPYCSLLYIKLWNVCVFSVFGFYRSVDWNSLKKLMMSLAWLFLSLQIVYHLYLRLWDPHVCGDYSRIEPT